MKRENPVGWMAVKEHKAQHDKLIPPPEQPTKPLSESLSANMRDLPIAAQIQILSKAFGIQLKEQDFINSAGLRAAEKGQLIPETATPGAPPTGEPQKTPVNVS